MYLAYTNQNKLDNCIPYDIQYLYVSILLLVINMKIVRWNLEKAQKLRKERKLEIERIVAMIEDKEYLGIVNVPSRPEQKMFLLDYEDYIVLVPFVENETEIFIKTAYRNRKVNKNLKG